jgi:hypothetical protein
MRVSIVLLDTAWFLSHEACLYVFKTGSVFTYISILERSHSHHPIPKPNKDIPSQMHTHKAPCLSKSKTKDL